MTKNGKYLLWGTLFILCAGLGFLQPVGGVWKGVLLVFSLLFFLPPALMLKSGNTEDRKLVQILSAASLILTVLLLVLNLFGAFWPEAMGTALHVVLVIVSTPMICSGYWVISLFLWACLLIASLKNRHDS